MKQQKKKVCFVSGEFFPDVGGLSKAATKISKMLLDSGFEIYVITPLASTVTKSTIIPQEMDGLLIYRVPVGKKLRNPSGNPLEKLNGITQLVKLIRKLDKQLNFDLFHGFYIPMAYACCLGMNKPHRPLVTSIRGSDAKQWSDPSMKNLLRLVLNKTSCLTTVNKMLLSNIMNAGGVNVNSMFIKNSIRLKTDISWNIETSTSGKIGTLGQFQKCKEIDVLLESYSKITTDMRNNLILIGNFPNESLELNYKNKVDLLKLQKEVTLTGLLNEIGVVQNLRDLNVFVSTSSSEGFPNALLEAAYLGVPIVVSNFPGIEDYCENDKNALIVPVGDVKATADAISSILSNKKLAMRLSKGAIKLAKTLTPENEKEQWVKLYTDLIEK